MPSKKTDEYVNLLIHDFDQSAANTLTFSEINIGLNIFDKVGLVIQRIEYEMTATTLRELEADTDAVVMALTVSDQLSGLGSDNRALIDRMEWVCSVVGTAGVALILQTPFVHDFSTMPGGGLIIPPRPLYCAITSTGGSAAFTSNRIRIYFTYIALSGDEYMELFETRRFLS